MPGSIFSTSRAPLIAGEALATTDTVCWLDSDIIITGEPDQLILEADEDFAACASDQEMGTTGPGNPFHPLWEQHCQTLGLTIDDLPWVTTEVDHKRIRLYWNGGLIVYRRATEFARHYMDTSIQLLGVRVASAAPGYSIAIKEMSAIGFAMIKQKLRWRALPDSHNSPIGSSDHKEHTAKRISERPVSFTITMPCGRPSGRNSCAVCAPPSLKSWNGWKVEAR